MVAGLFLWQGCAGPFGSKSHVDEKIETYTDPESGVAFPERVDSLDRLSLNKEAADKNPVSAHYSVTEHGSAAPGLEADIRVIPAVSANPDQLLGQTIRSVETLPDFARNDYRGSKDFGTERVFCTQCSFKRPGRVIRWFSRS